MLVILPALLPTCFLLGVCIQTAHSGASPSRVGEVKISREALL